MGRRRLCHAVRLPAIYSHHHEQMIRRIFTEIKETIRWYFRDPDDPPYWRMEFAIRGEKEPLVMARAEIPGVTDPGFAVKYTEIILERKVGLRRKDFRLIKVELIETDEFLEEKNQYPKPMIEKAAAKVPEKEARAPREQIRVARFVPPQRAKGVTRPGANTLTGRVWEICDELSEAAGEPVPRADVMQQGQAEGLNPATIATQYSRWRKFHGLTGQAIRRAPAQQEE